MEIELQKKNPLKTLWLMKLEKSTWKQIGQVNLQTVINIASGMKPLEHKFLRNLHFHVWEFHFRKFHFRENSPNEMLHLQYWKIEIKIWQVTSAELDMQHHEGESYHLQRCTSLKFHYISQCFFQHESQKNDMHKKQSHISLNSLKIAQAILMIT